jgi:glutamate/tyrosine decarboxylase-like PLP-dependent enzyme
MFIEIAADAPKRAEEQRPPASGRIVLSCRQGLGHRRMACAARSRFVLIRDAATMRAAFSVVPPYLRTDGNLAGVGGPPWFSEYGFQQTRSFRALKVWMCLKHHGLSGYRAAIDHDLAMAARLADRIREQPDLELLAPQQLSIVCFRYAPPRADASTLNETNRMLLERLQLGGRAFLSSTVIEGTFWLRACVVNYRTTAADIDILPELVRSLGDRVSGDVIP